MAAVVAGVVSEQTREPPRRRLKPAARRAQIIESAKLAWSRTGARRTTVQHIAREAGISEHFVYRHFGSREEIFRLAVLAPLDQALARLLGRLQEAESGSEDAALQRINQAFLTELPAMIPLMSAAQFGDPVVGPRFYREVLVPGVQAALHKPMKALIGLPASSVWMNLAIRALIGAHFALALESTLEEGTVDLARLAGEMDWTFGRGFAATRRSLPMTSSMRRLPRPPVAAPVEHAPPRKLLPRAERVAVTLVAARAVFLARGLRGARTREIADRAGITEAFLLRIFSSKKRLYEASVLEPLASGLAELARCTRELRDKVRVEDLPAAYLRLALPFFAVNGPLFVGALFAELGEARDYFHNALVPQLREIEAAIAPGLPQGMDPGIVRRLLSGACWAVSFDARVDPRIGLMLELLMLGSQPPIDSRPGWLESR